MTELTLVQNSPLVGVIMGSSSDWDVMKNAVDILKQFGVPFEAQVIANDEPDRASRHLAACRQHVLGEVV